MFIRYKGLTLGGRQGPLLITEFQAPTLELKSNYTDRLNADGQMVAKDWLGKALWVFTIATNGESLQDALSAAQSLQSRWQDATVRKSSSPVAFEYSHDGETWYRIYGKPGSFTSLVPDTHAKLGVGYLDVEFVQTDPRIFDSTEKQVKIGVVPASIGGIVAPIVSPITTVSTGQARAGRLVNTGDLPAPATVIFKGPATNPTLTTDKGFEIQYKGTLAYDQSVTIDPLNQSVKLNTGADVPGRLSRKTRLSSLTVPVGTSDWYFKATDTTGTATAEIRYRSAHSSFR